MTVAVIVGYVAALGVGLLLALIGGGGAILTLPILVYAFGLPAWTATTHSLFIVGAVAAVGAIRQARSGNVDYAAALRFALPAVLAIQLVRKLVVPAMPAQIPLPIAGTVAKDTLVMGVLVVAMVASAVAVVRGSRPRAAEVGSATTPRRGASRLAHGALRGFGVGLFTGFVGAGGGFLLVPALAVVEGLPLKRAVATSLLVIAVNSLLGFLGDVTAGAVVVWPLLFGFTAVAALGMLVGGSLARRLSEQRVRGVFSVILVVLACAIVAMEIWKQT